MNVFVFVCLDFVSVHSGLGLDCVNTFDVSIERKSVTLRVMKLNVHNTSLYVKSTVFFLLLLLLSETYSGSVKTFHQSGTFCKVESDLYCSPGNDANSESQNNSWILFNFWTGMALSSAAECSHGVSYKLGEIQGSCVHYRCSWRSVKTFISSK